MLFGINMKPRGWGEWIGEATSINKGRGSAFTTYVKISLIRGEWHVDKFDTELNIDLERGIRAVSHTTYVFDLYGSVLKASRLEFAVVSGLRSFDEKAMNSEIHETPGLLHELMDEIRRFERCPFVQEEICRRLGELNRQSTELLRKKEELDLERTELEKSSRGL